MDLPPAAEAGTAELAAGFDRVIFVATPALTSLHLSAVRLRELAEAGTPAEALRVVLNRTGPADLVPLDRVEQLFAHPLALTLPDDYPSLAATEPRGLCESSPLAHSIRRLAIEVSRCAQPLPAPGAMPQPMLSAALAAAGSDPTPVALM